MVKKLEKVIRNGKVAVLYSPGFGAGWYSWNTKNKELLFHPTLVKMVEEGKQNEITEEFIENELNISDIYAGGSETLTIEWIPEGTLFRITEYDGSESIITMDTDDYIQA